MFNCEKFNKACTIKESEADEMHPLFICMCACVCMMCIYVCMCLSIYTHALYITCRQYKGHPMT